MFELEGKVALITGGNTGLGFAYTEILAKNGCDIIVVGHNCDYKNIESKVVSYGRKFLFIKANLLEEEDINKVYKESIKEFGRVDILVNNAGTIKRREVLEHTYDDFEMVLNLNLISVFKLSQLFGKRMKEQGSGKIINIASMLSYQGGKFVPGYTASKHGVNGLTKSFANELAMHNVQVNAIAPGYVKTANTEPIRNDKERNLQILSRIPINRWADPDDIAGAVLFLASDYSNYVNGITIPVDGGWLSN